MEFDTTNSVGDVTSTERGSGARYNSGKPHLALIPLRQIAESFGAAGGDVATALALLGSFQTTQDVRYLVGAIRALKSHWRDCANVFDYGRKKYAEWNWAKGMSWSVVMSCAARHALYELEGEKDDQESGLPHAGHFLCNLVMLRTFVESYPEGNDLPPSTLFGAVL